MRSLRVVRSHQVDQVMDLIERGEWVSVHVGGLRVPRRNGIGPADALCEIEDRLLETGGLLLFSPIGDAARRFFRGRKVVIAPDKGETGPGPDTVGDREPRHPVPSAPACSAALQLSTSS